MNSGDLDKLTTHDYRRIEDWFLNLDTKHKQDTDITLYFKVRQQRIKSEKDDDYQSQ